MDAPDRRLRRLLTTLRVSGKEAAEWGLRRTLRATHVPQLGAARIGLSDDHWQEFVEERANAAYAVVMAASPTLIGDGLRWEMELIGNRVPHGRVVLVVGPHRKIIAGPLLLYAVGRHVANHRSGLISAAAGAVALLTMAAIAFALSS